MSPGPRLRRSPRTPLLVGAALGAATLLVAVRDPHDGGYLVCPVLLLTGLQCAGCGGLRAAHDLATGDLAGAWSMNPFLTIAMPVAAVLWAVVGVAAVGFGVLRNVPSLAGVLGPG
jgi:hypothetical protein